PQSLTLPGELTLGAFESLPPLLALGGGAGLDIANRSLDRSVAGLAFLLEEGLQRLPFRRPAGAGLFKGLLVGRGRLRQRSLPVGRPLPRLLGRMQGRLLLSLQPVPFHLGDAEVRDEAAQLLPLGRVRDEVGLKGLRLGLPSVPFSADDV